MSLLGYPKVIPYIKFEHFGIIRFLVMLRTNKQTDKLTDGVERHGPTHDDRHNIIITGTIKYLQAQFYT